MFIKACFFIFIKLNGEGASPLTIPHILDKFLFEKENDNVCELKGGRPVNGIAWELPMFTFIVFFLTMEINERGCKIKGPH